jgi:hypothetical protein
MKVSELFEASKLGYKGKGTIQNWGGRKFYDKPSYQQGPVKDWMKAGGVSKEDIAKAVEEIQRTPEFRAVIASGLAFDRSHPAQLKKGTLTFTGLKFSKNDITTSHYSIYSNGLIRLDVYGDMKAYTKLKSPKPRMTQGDPVRSLLSTYKASLIELADKWKKINKGVKSVHDIKNDEILKIILRKMKQVASDRFHGGNDAVQAIIDVMRAQGKNIPEFKAIEKSLKAAKEQD